MTKRWTHNGEPVGQPQKPWRLTHVQRVEMEALLATFRSEGIRGPDDEIGLATSTRDALMVFGSHGRRVLLPHRDGALSERTIRARVAIALRAALRADEDARCEEAIVRALAQAKEDGDFWAEPGIYDGARACYEWPWAGRPTKWPLALWEVEERRRRETVRAVVALLAWGLS